MLVYYDFETTGLNQFHDNITEYCFIKEKSKEKLSSLVNPQKPIPEIVTKITGITQQMVDNAPIFQDHLQNILQFLSTPNKYTYLVAHNGDNFDFIILREQLKKIGHSIYNIPLKSIDTLMFAKKLYPNINKYSLSNLCKQFGINVLSAHRAESDTIMVKSLLYYMVNDLASILGMTQDYLINNPEHIYNYINSI